MTLFLHNPASQAHLEDLRGRLMSQVPDRPSGIIAQGETQVERLLDVVRSMDKGTITFNDARDAFNDARVSGFSFGRWLGEMVEEGVYRDAVYDKAA